LLHEIEHEKRSTQSLYRSKDAGPVGGQWSDLRWLVCEDGTTRPTKPGLFPLAYGHPEDMAKLRAYGNAIVPAVAATFVSAFLDAVDELTL
jgi:DNA (cytosine-5)-methyltransferase 1